MIYFDNAATTAVKPPEVAEAVARAVNSFGGVGRGVHEASLARAMPCSGRASSWLGCSVRPIRRASSFASNATEALNTAIAGSRGRETSW